MPSLERHCLLLSLDVTCDTGNGFVEDADFLFLAYKHHS